MEETRTVFDVYEEAYHRAKKKRALIKEKDATIETLIELLEKSDVCCTAACEYYYVQSSAPETLEEKIERGSDWDIKYMESKERLKDAVEDFRAAIYNNLIS